MKPPAGRDHRRCGTFTVIQQPAETEDQAPTQLVAEEADIAVLVDEVEPDRGCQATVVERVREVGRDAAAELGRSFDDCRLTTLDNTFSSARARLTNVLLGDVTCRVTRPGWHGTRSAATPAQGAHRPRQKRRRLSAVVRGYLSLVK